MEKPCVFCDRKNFEEQLIAEVNGFYIVASRGQITEGYVLLIPEEHAPCMGALYPNRNAAMEVLIAHIECAISEEYRADSSRVSYPLTMFEHGIVGQTILHAHMHFLPPQIDLTHSIRRDFPGAKMQDVRHMDSLGDRYRTAPQPYLLCSTPSRAFMVCWNPSAPPQYLRTVAASILGVPERANWRTMDQKLDEKLWRETVRRLKPYF